LDALELELPLKVIAPLFLAAQKNLAQPQVKAAVAAEIPDLFFGFPQAAAPVTPVAPVVPPLPRPLEQKPSDTNFYVWGDKGEVPQTDTATLRKTEMPQTDFMSRQAHPKEVVARAAELPGVAGAVVAMQDGLRVASQVPAELNADTLAVFLPQIFERVNQSTRELRMGALNNVNFTVGNVPWKIFRVNSVYFAAFGRAGEALPSAQLAQLAAELDRKKQK
jgi:predicted regulator of Ras-like GTPase activity (Roadblock/LC7/MglB family)